MASHNLGFLSLAILMIAGSLVFGDLRVSAQCGTSFQAVYSQCSQYVLGPGPGAPPSQACCDVIRPLDIPCFCSFVSQAVERLVSMEKLVNVARYCGLTIQPRMRCGSYTVPPA
ncbi:hypothetical protein PTKIN_Ptkin11bG0091800 [Pterospermum kingtungense]